MSQALQAEIQKLLAAATDEAEIARRVEECEDRDRRVQFEALRRPVINQWLARAGVGERHRDALWTVDCQLLPKPMYDWANRFPLGSMKGASAVLAGPPGTGKTMTSVWLMLEAYKSGNAQDGHWRCPSAEFVSSAELFAKVFVKEPLERYERTNLLVIDDWGMAYETEWPLAMMDRLIDRRWSENRSTVVTTNLQPFKKNGADSFEARYPRVFSRLADSSGPGVITLAREDMRRKERA